MADYEDVLLTEEEKEEIKNNAPDKLPLNPTAQGYSGALVRKKTSEFVTGEEKSVLALLGQKFQILYNLFSEIDARTILDEVTTDIDYTLEQNVDKTFTQDISSAKITFDSTVEHGFEAGINFKSGVSPFAVEFINNSSYDLKIINNGIEISNYTPSTSKTINLFVFSDGLFIYCYIKEI